ncbi:unnamed protein product [Adineta ricciae]|nr:unnamed protein product [Adineta ricciae]
MLYFGVILLTAGVYANVSLKIAWFNNNFASLTRRAVASATIVSIGTIGGAVAGQIYQDKQKPQYFLGNSISLGCIVVQTILVLSLRFIFIYENRRRGRFTKEQIERQIERYGGNDLVGDRHPDFRYTL